MDRYQARKYLIAGIMLLVGILMVVRLFSLQVLDSSYKFSAENNSQRHITQYPARGLIYDRNHELIVYNQAVYDLIFNPSQSAAFDTALFCELLGISSETARSGIDAARAYSRFKPSIFLKQISAETYAVFQEQMHRFPGFFVQPRTLRSYSRPIGAHLLGYVGEVDEKLIKEDSYYQMGDYKGISGIEKAYEAELRGIKGVKIYLVDVHNRVKEPYMGGRYDVPAVVGRDLLTTIDADLQAYGEKLMEKFRGSIVALEPSTGEVLALVSSPEYDPGLLVGRIRSENYKRLSEDTLKPLFNRALMAQYPPGSTFKVVNGLIGLHEGVIRPGTEYYCDLGWHYGSYHVGCHVHDSPLAFEDAVQNSCNAYFVNVFKNILTDKKFDNTAEAFQNWRKHVMSFGLGKKLGTDFTHELAGLIPDKSLYDNIYGEGHWNFLTVRSLAIGQGELGITPIQMANMAATLANRGHYYPPHVVKAIDGQEISERFLDPNYTTIDSSHFEYVINGMEKAVNGGRGSTAWRARLKDITVCGKTGTAENPPYKDHSIFIAFAPKEDPKIAISVYVENGGFGNIWASPIASLMIEKYLNDSTSRPYMEEYVLAGMQEEEKEEEEE